MIIIGVLVSRLVIIMIIIGVLVSRDFVRSDMYLESIHACKVQEAKTEPFVIVQLAHIVRASPSHRLRIMNIFENAQMMNTLCEMGLSPRRYYACNDIFTTEKLTKCRDGTYTNMGMKVRV